MSRRQILLLAGEAAASLALFGCAASPPLRKEVFADFGDPAHPYFGLATSLREEHSYQARLEGNLPAELRGTLYRNGPGLFDRGGLRKRNLLDGDGMVQSFRFAGAGVHYRNRFVRTEKYLAEQAAGRFIFSSWSTQAPGGFWANFMGAGGITGQAGVTVFAWRGRLYAFDECALPYELDPDTLETSGVSSLGLPGSMTIYAAHAKMDPVTGEWLHFGVLYGPKPMLHITIFEPNGTLKLHRSLPMPRNVYMHDWFVCGRHLIFTLHPVHIAYQSVFWGRKSISESLSWKPERGNLIMVLDREGDKPPLLLESSACYMWHSFNAFNRGAEIVADFIGYDNPDHFVGPDPIATAIMVGRRGSYAFPGSLRRYLIDPAAGTIRDELLDAGNYEWPRVNELHRCYDYRFGYMLKTRPEDFFWNIVCRIDMRTGRIESYDFGKGSYLTEPVFIPLPGRLYLPGDACEPGFLLVEVYDSASRRSYLAVLRAENLASGPVAIVHLNHHVPFSYHGWWSAGT
ncbi:MAG: dioxygenase [Geobacteraceae bacterium GWC2_58_44]|nr:MAG: dioxygenase [Geobacteraceae bacterium GWC2_58_44]HBG06255.1 dioxygenase [Geobacter sp.]